MSRRGTYIFIFFTLIGGTLGSCDTSNSIDDPAQDRFIRYYGRDGDQEGVDVVVGTDGSLYLLGNTTATGTTVGKQLYLVKTDPEGNVIQQRTFSGKSNVAAKDIELTSDGRLVVLANFEAAADDRDIFILTLNDNLVTLDSAVFGYAGFNEEASSVTQIFDGFIVAGYTTNITVKPTDPNSANDHQDALFARFTDDLTVVTEQYWKPKAGFGTIDVAVKIVPVPSSVSASSTKRFYVFGYSNKLVGTQNDLNFWYFGLNNDGEIPSGGDWTAGTTTNDDEVLGSVSQSPIQFGAGYMLVGNSINANGEYDIFVTKLKDELQFNSQDYFYSHSLLDNLGSLDISHEQRVSVYSSVSSGFLILSNERSTTSSNFFLTKIDAAGKPVWSDPESRVFGGQQDDFIGSVLEMPDEKILMIGTMELGDEGQKKMALIKVNKDGKFLK